MPTKSLLRTVIQQALLNSIGQGLGGVAAGGGGAGAGGVLFSNVLLRVDFEDIHGGFKDYLDYSNDARLRTESGTNNYNVGKFGQGLSIGSGNVTYTNSPVMDFGTEDFCIEGWFHGGAGNLTALAVPSCFGINRTTTLNQFRAFVFNAAAAEIISITSVTDNGTSLKHVAFTRESSTFRLFINGVLEGTGTSAEAVRPANANIRIDQTMAADDLRVVKGQAVYTANFDVPAVALPIS
jgi:hypothetical protein